LESARDRELVERLLSLASGWDQEYRSWFENYGFGSDQVRSPKKFFELMCLVVLDQGVDSNRLFGRIAEQLRSRKLLDYSYLYDHFKLSHSKKPLKSDVETYSSLLVKANYGNKWGVYRPLARNILELAKAAVEEYDGSLMNIYRRALEDAGNNIGEVHFHLKRRLEKFGFRVKADKFLMYISRILRIWNIPPTNLDIPVDERVRKTARNLRIARNLSVSSIRDSVRKLYPKDPSKLDYALYSVLGGLCPDDISSKVKCNSSSKCPVRSYCTHA